MNTTFKIKLLQYLYSRNHSRGFSWIELIIVIFILGILAAIALPSLLSIAGSSRCGAGFEARQFVSAMNKIQQAYYLENPHFANSLEEMNSGIKNQTDNYNYSSRSTTLAAFSYGISRQKSMKSFVGGVFMIPDQDGTDQVMTVAILCESKSPGQTLISDPIIEKNTIKCSSDAKEVGRDTSSSILVSKDATLSHQAFNYIATRNYEQAQKIANSIKHPYFKAISYAAAGNYTQAQKIAEEIKDSNIKAQVLNYIDRTQIKDK